MRLISLLTILLLLVFAGGCNPYKQDSYQQKYVVESYLVEGRALPPVQLSTTVPADQKYNFTDVAVSGAKVQIQLLDGSGIPQRSYKYYMYSAGFYVPEDSGIVLSQGKYHLVILVPGSSGTIEATAVVPKAFHIVNNPPDSILYQSGDGIDLKVTRSYYPGRQSEYIASAMARGELDTTRLTPFYADVLTRGNNDTQLSDYRINNSPILNEADFPVNSDGTITAIYPWIGIAYYGRNSLVLNAIDDNIYDFVRSQSVQTGGNTLPPGQMQNAIMHVKGGIGVFGAMATDTVNVYIKQNPNL